MDRVEAKWVLLRSLAKYRQYDYEQLREMMGEPRCVEVSAASGRDYQLEFEPIWDAQPNGDIRVLGSIDDYGWRALFPLSCDFLVSPPSAISAVSQADAP
jgi:hypothetical protein